MFIAYKKCAFTFNLYAHLIIFTCILCNINIKVLLLLLLLLLLVKIKLHR